MIHDSTAPSAPNVLAQISADPTPSRFLLAILNRANVRDGELSVRFKAVAGREDRSAGLVWRYVNPDNYYLVRVNALKNNLMLFKMDRGQLTPLAVKGKSNIIAVRHNIPSNSWGTLKVVYRGPVFSIYLNHRRLMLVQDNSLRASGKVGLWTQSDSVTYFDDFQVKAR